MTQRDLETCSSRMKPKKIRKNTLLAMWMMLAWRKMAVRTVHGNMGVGASHCTNRSRIMFPEANGSKMFPTIAPMTTYTATRMIEKITVGDRRRRSTVVDPVDSEDDSNSRALLRSVAI